MSHLSSRFRSLLPVFFVVVGACTSGNSALPLYAPDGGEQRGEQRGEQQGMSGGSSGQPGPDGPSGSAGTTGAGGAGLGQGGSPNPGQGGNLGRGGGGGLGTGGSAALGGASGGPGAGGSAGSMARDGSADVLRPPVGSDAALLPGALTCAINDDCTTTSYNRPVTTEADCYCTGCPTNPLNKQVAEQYRVSYQRICAQWLARSSCPAVICAAIITPVSCVAGMCSTGRPAMVTCSMPGSGCTNNAVKCGAACCKSGESCDDATKTCRCGTAAGCTGEAICGNPGAFVCGSFCCGAGTGRVCPR